MIKIKHSLGPAPILTVLGVLAQPGEPKYTLCVLPIPGQDFYTLICDHRGQQTNACITAESALELLREYPFQRTTPGEDFLASRQPRTQECDRALCGLWHRFDELKARRRVLASFDFVTGGTAGCIPCQ